jgi:hypothetical protein
MTTLSHSIDIAAAPDVVWATVANLDAYRDWNPFVINASGAIVAGARLGITLRTGSRTTAFTPTVLAVEPGRSVRWLGRLVLPGIFDGEHELIVDALPDGTSRFTQRERFRGILVALMPGLLRDTDAGFIAMNEALKARVEATVAA